MRIFQVLLDVNKHSVLLLNSILWYECTSLFNCLTTGGHMSCFQFWTIMNKAVMDVHRHRFLGERKFSFLWDKCSGVQFLDHRVNWFVLKEVAKLIFRVAILVYAPNSNVWVIQFNVLFWIVKPKSSLKPLTVDGEKISKMAWRHGSLG